MSQKSDRKTKKKALRFDYHGLNLKETLVLTLIFGMGTFVSIFLFYTGLNRYTTDQRQQYLIDAKQYENYFNSFTARHTLGLKHIINSTALLSNVKNAPLSIILERFLEDSKFEGLAIVELSRKSKHNGLRTRLVKSEGETHNFDLSIYESFSRFFLQDRGLLIKSPRSFLFRPPGSEDFFLGIAVPAKDKPGMVFLGFISMKSLLKEVHVNESLIVVFEVLNRDGGIENLAVNRFRSGQIVIRRISADDLMGSHEVLGPTAATGSNISMRFLVSDFEKVGWPWFVLMGCLLLTFLLSAWIMGLMRRNVEVQEMVRIRTAELESEKRKAENANSAKSRFLANMSHEVRTPLNIILGMTELLTETELEEQQLSNLKTISRSAYHLLSLIEDILEMNRLEADELELANDRFNIKMVVNEVVRFVATPIRTKKLRFHYYISPDVPRFLVGDARRLKQVILNLINNSLKFTDSGFVSLEIRVLKSNGNHVELEFVVSDSGIGIKNEDRERIFKSFVQLDPSSTRNKGGVGLGLSIVKTYVEKMGGLVEIDSNVEVGTRIRAKLGFELADGMSRWIDAYDLRADLIGKRVYVLCSSDIDFQNISDSLEYFGAIVEHEKSGQKFASDFLEVVDRNDFLILDSDLDDMGAVEGLGLNRKLLKKTDRMIVLLHQKHRKDDVAILNSMGIERICFRPLLFNEFFKALQFGKTYSSKPYRSESKPVEGIVPNTLPVLIAEDDPDNRVLIGAFLKPMNLNLTFASDGLDALEKFKKIRPQIVITDIQMPRLDGFGFLKAAQEHLETERDSQECYFMVLTADAMPEQIAEAKKYGVEEYLTKPIRKKDLIQKTIKAYEALMKSEG